MRPLLLLPLFVSFACSPDDAAWEPWHGDDDGTPFLTDEVERFPLHTKLFDAPGDARLRHDGPPLPPVEGLWQWESELLVVELADQLRVLWSGQGVELLLWLDRADLVDVAAYETIGVARPGAAPDTHRRGQVVVPSGTEVDLSTEDGDHVLASWDAWATHSTARVSAWVHIGDVDQVWEATPAGVAVSSRDALLRGDILDRPGGIALAEPVGADGLTVERTGDPTDGWWPVAWSNGLTRVDGWAYEEDLEWLDLTIGGWGNSLSCACGGSFFLHGREDMVPVGTPLRADRDGPVVARTTEVQIVPGFDAGEGWLSVHTPWGEAELFADPLDQPEP